MSHDRSVPDPPTSGNGTIDLLVDRTRLLWLLAIAFFGVGDLVTTAVGLTTGWAAEMGPIAAVAIAEYGLPMMLPLKSLAFGLCYAVWRATPDPYRVGVPLGLASLGVYVTAQNSFVLALAAYISLS